MNEMFNYEIYFITYYIDIKSAGLFNNFTEHFGECSLNVNQVTITGSNICLPLPVVPIVHHCDCSNQT